MMQLKENGEATRAIILPVELGRCRMMQRTFSHLVGDILYFHHAPIFTFTFTYRIRNQMEAGFRMDSHPCYPAEKVQRNMCRLGKYTSLSLLFMSHFSRVVVEMDENKNHTAVITIDLFRHSSMHSVSNDLAASKGVGMCLRDACLLSTVNLQR